VVNCLVVGARFCHFNRVESMLKLQQMLTVLPMMKLVVSIALFYYVIMTDNGAVMLSYMDTIISTIALLYKTFLWFMIIAIAWGWQIFKTSLSREEEKEVISLNVLVFLTTCFDLLCLVLNISEIGPVILYLNT
jgi:hypothetical protein